MDVLRKDPDADVDVTTDADATTTDAATMDADAATMDAWASTT